MEKDILYNNNNNRSNEINYFRYLYYYILIVCVCKPFNRRRQGVQSRNTFGFLTICFVHVICVNIRANVAVWIVLQSSNCRTICEYTCVVQEMRASESCYYHGYFSHRCVLCAGIIFHVTANVHRRGTNWSRRDTRTHPSLILPVSINYSDSHALESTKWFIKTNNITLRLLLISYYVKTVEQIIFIKFKQFFELWRFDIWWNILKKYICIYINKLKNYTTFTFSYYLQVIFLSYKIIYFNV